MTLPRVYPILDSGIGAWPALGLAAATRALLEGGAGIVQFRHKGAWTRAVYEEVREAASLARAAGIPAIVDDRADIARLVGAGLHLGQDDLPPADARRLLGSEAVIGYSSHNPAQLCAAAAEPVDYVALGPVFATASKRNPDPVVGVEQVRACRALMARPLVAIGGITRANALDVLAAGADAVAVIGDFAPSPCTAETLRERMQTWQRLLKT